MVPSMILTMPFLTSAYQVRRLRISLPLVECLIDNERYFQPDTLPAPVGEELRPIARPRITNAPRDGGGPRAHSPSWMLNR